MDLKKIGIVLSREFSIRVKKKSFIITTLVTPILLAAMMIVPVVLMNRDYNDHKVYEILVKDDSGIILPELKSNETIIYQPAPEQPLDSLKNNFASLDAYALLHISALDEKGDVSMESYCAKELHKDVKRDVSRAVNDLISKRKLMKYEIDNIDKILKDINTNIEINTYVIGKDGQSKQTSSTLSMILSYAMSFFIYIFVLLFGNMIMQGVIEEKTTRIVEVIVSSVKPFELMVGKILGVACVAVTQFLIWVVFTGLLILGFSFIGGGASPEAVSTMAGVDPAMVDSMANPTMVGQLMASLSAINWPLILGCFLIYFILGYLLYASMFAAVGSAVDNEADTQQLSMPVTMPLIIGLLLMMHAFQYPESSLSFWASIIPFTSPMVMLARIPFAGAVPVWELLLSIGLLFVTFLVIAYFSGKIYRVGILLYGKKHTFKDLWKWLKY